MNKIVIVGERANVREMVPSKEENAVNPDFLIRCGAFRSGRCYDFLRDLGLRWDDGMNLLHPSRYAPWCADTAAKVANFVRAHLDREYDVVVLCGTKVRAAFGLGHVEWLERYAKYLVIPHPSGRCRTWNDPEFRARARDVFREVTR